MSKAVIAIVAVVVVLVLFPVAAHLLKGDAGKGSGSDAVPEAVPAAVVKPSAAIEPPPVSAVVPAAPAVPAGTPVVVEMDPPNDATDVSPAIAQIHVTFSVAMGPDYSWCVGGPTFPGAGGGAKPFWSADQKTCTLPVNLAPNTFYELGLNSRSFKNFKSASGVPLTPVLYSFSTGSQ